MKRYLILFFLIASFLSLTYSQNNAQDRIILKSNEQFSGKIILHNENIISIQDAEGMRYQFPLSDVKEIYKASDPASKSVTADEAKDITRIVLTTGEAYTGEVVFQNEQIIMIKTAEGTRYQFPFSEIRSVDTDINMAGYELLPDVDIMSKTDDNKFAMLIEVQGGASYSSKAYKWAPMVQPTLVLGARDILLDNSFLGIGGGYRVILPTESDDDETISFIPVFLRFQAFFSEKRTCPYAEMDAGYSFALNDSMKGGLFINAAFGFRRQLNESVSMSVALFGGIQSFSADLIDSKNFQQIGQNYTYYGKTNSVNFGLKITLGL